MTCNNQSTKSSSRVTHLILLVFALAVLSLGIPERSASAASGPGFDLGTVARRYHFKFSGQSDGRQLAAIGWFEADATGLIIAGNVEVASVLGTAIIQPSLPVANGSGRFTLLDDTNGIYRLVLVFANANERITLDTRVLLDDLHGRRGSMLGNYTVTQFSLSALGSGLGEIVSQ